MSALGKGPSSPGCTALLDIGCRLYACHLEHPHPFHQHRHHNTKAAVPFVILWGEAREVVIP